MKHSQEKPQKIDDSQTVNWMPWLGVLFVVVVFFLSQLFAGAGISLYPLLQDWSTDQANEWLSNSVGVQFAYILIVGILSLGALWQFLRMHGRNFKAIGLFKPKWRDLRWALAAVPVYYLIYLISVSLASWLIPGFDAQQEQEIGFENVKGLFQLSLVFASLVIIPPVVEEIMVRGFLYTSLKKAMKLAPAVIITSLMFAVAHLQTGSEAGPLYVAAVDTFILSLILIYLREKTGSLWASIYLHGFKNGVAFMAIFVFGL